MRRYAVIGNPVRHSYSPWLHRQFARQTQRQLVYAAYCPSGTFAECAEAFFAGGGSGLNITLPYKADALAFAGHASDFARRANAANVLRRAPDGRIGAYNTDGSGLLCDLRRLGISIKDRRILLLGAGGAARAVALALADAAPRQLLIYNRTASRADALVQLVQQTAKLHDCRYITTLPDASDDEPADLIINATAAGHGQSPIYPPQLFADCPLVYDISYGKAARAFLSQASHARQTADGSGMLAWQAALSFALWEGVLPSVQAVIDQLSFCAE